MSLDERTPFPRYHPDNSLPPSGLDWIWVFGSNLAGRHGAGAAKVAKVSFSAQFGYGCGPTGRAYAIPTKDANLNVIGLDQIEQSVQDFLLYAKLHPELNFFATRVGCGLDGYRDEQIGPMFAGAPENCSLPVEWKLYTIKTGAPL